MHLFEHQIATGTSQQMTKVTGMIRKDVEESGVKDGIVVVYSPDPDVVHDMLCGLEETFPTRRPYYQHMEGNSHAHLKTSCVGPSQTLILENGQLILGIWQDVYFCEFDGPRNRRFFVKILEG